MSIITDLSVNKRWYARKGDDNNFTITFVDDQAAAFDISGYTFSLQIYKFNNKGTAILELTEGGGITNNGATGILDIAITDAQSDVIKVDEYYYQLKAVLPSGNVNIIFQGVFEIVEFNSNLSYSTGVTATVNLSGSDVTATISLSGGGTTTTASNGLNLSGDDVRLGGALTSSTGINGLGTYSLQLQNLTNFSATGNSYVSLQVPSNFTFLMTAGGDAEFFDFRGTKKGITYVSSGYVTDPQSLTDKEYVDNQQLTSYTVATLPSATTAGKLIYVSDETGGSIIAFSDGTNWRRSTDRAIVS